MKHWRGMGSVRKWMGSVEAIEAMEFRYTAGLKLGYFFVGDGIPTQVSLLEGFCAFSQTRNPRHMCID